MFEIAICGLIQCFLLNSSCIFLLLCVSKTASFIAFVTLSAYKTTSEFGFLAALQIICINAVVDLKKPS